MTESRSVAPWEWGWWGRGGGGDEERAGRGRRHNHKGAQKKLGGNEYAHYINYSDGFKGEYLCQN